MTGAVSPGRALPHVSREVSFDVFDKVASQSHSPGGSVSGGVGFSSPLGPKLGLASSSAVRAGSINGSRRSPANTTPKADVDLKFANASGPEGLISAYRDLDVGAPSAALDVQKLKANTPPSAVERAKARLDSWKTMADRLESVMVKEEQARLMRATRQSSPGTFKTIGQLRKEIHAMKAQTVGKAQTANTTKSQGIAPAPSHASLQQLTLLESKVHRYEAKLQRRDDAIDQLKSSVSKLQALLMEKQEQLGRAKEDVQVSARLMDESAAEFAALKATSDRSFGKIKSLQSEVASLRAQVEDGDVALKKQEQLTALETSRRLELEQRLVDTDDAISRLKTKVESSKKRMAASHDSLEMENKGLRHDVMALKQACMEAKRLATEHAEAAMEVARQRDALEREGVERKLEVKGLRAELHMERQKARVAEEAAAAAAAELYVLRATEKRDTAEVTSAEELRMEFAATKQVLETMTSNAKVAKAEVSALKEELRKARVAHDEEIESLKREHEQALVKERKENMDALREIEASHAAQIRQDVDRIEQAKVALAGEVEELDAALRGKEEVIDGLQQMVKDREASMVEMKGNMESMKMELMERQDEVEALLTARLKEEMDRAGGAADGSAQAVSKVRASPMKRFIAKLSPTKRKKKSLELRGDLPGV